MQVLVVDLNNFSRYPTMSVGYLVASLRDAGAELSVLSPLATGVNGYPRLTRAPRWGLVDARVRYWSATTANEQVRRLRDQLGNFIFPGNSGDRRAILQQFEASVDDSIDAVLISTYTMYRDICADICEIAARRRIPVLIGGSYFNQKEVIDDWLQIDGLSALSGGEPEGYIAPLLKDLISGKKDLSDYPAVSRPGAPNYLPAPPFDELESSPFPDYSDFPWSEYPNRIIPMMTARGCGWGACTFCSDVRTSSGRSFRTRSAAHVAKEMAYQSERHDARLFAFLDLKLNSDLSVWRLLCAEARQWVEGAMWTASVHVDLRTDNGLGATELERAASNGLVRVTTGLESASARILKKMAKGTSPERLSEFVRAAASRGISVRLTAIVGHPGETAADVDETRRFLEENASFVDRVMLNRFSVMLGTTIADRMMRYPHLYPDASLGALDTKAALFEVDNRTVLPKSHRSAVFQLLQTIHSINRKALPDSAREFEGVM